jgi:hypothetical protein
MEETVQAPRGELPRREAMQTPEEVAAMLRLKALGGVSDGRTALAVARSETAASQFDTKIIEGFELWFDKDERQMAARWFTGAATPRAGNRYACVFVRLGFARLAEMMEPL